jgi:isocitrate dehydrogenase
MLLSFLILPADMFHFRCSNGPHKFSASDCVSTSYEFEGTIETRAVTYDLARLMQDGREVKCSEFGSAVIQAM